VTGDGRAAAARFLPWAVVAAAVAAGALARLYRIDMTWFFLEQTKGVEVAAGIAAGRSAPLLGMPIGWTSARSGPLHFYLLAVPFLAAPSPVAAAVFVALLGVAALAVLYWFAREYYGQAVALTAVWCAAVFPPSAISTRAIWNPGWLPLFVVLFCWALHALVVNGRSAAIIGVLGSLAALTQLHTASAALVLAALLAIAAFRPRVRPAHAVLGLPHRVQLYAP
jgi:hypothetical protein